MSLRNGFKIFCAVSDDVTSLVCSCQTILRAANANIRSAVVGVCPLGNDSVRHGLHWSRDETDDAKRLNSASAINAQLV